MRDDGGTALLERARERFFADGDSAGLEPWVRPLILASWRRSARHGLKPAEARPIVVDHVGIDGQLVRAARAPIDSRFSALAGLGAAITITDERGRVLERWVEDLRMTRWLDHGCVVAGSSLAENDIGTASSGIALETGESTLVTGWEHFAEGASRMSTAGAPVRHPVGSHIIGTVNLTCDFSSSSPLMLAWIREVAERIEDALVDSLTGGEQALVRAYLRGARDSRHPVVCMNETTVIGNAVAVRMLADVDMPSLWESASRVVRDGKDHEIELASTSGGGDVRVLATPISLGTRVIGAELRSSGHLHHATSARATPPRRSSAQEIPGLVGRSIAWQQLCTQLAASGDDPLLLIGEPGVGKTAVLSAIAPDAVVVDVARLLAGGDDWIGALRAVLQSTHGAVAIENLHLLDADAMSIACATIFSRPPTTRIMATIAYEAGHELNEATGLSFPQWPGSVVRIPPLRERHGDIPLLLRALTRTRTGSGIGPVWTLEAIHTLTRVQWLANVASLDRVVRQVLRSLTSPQVRAADLPPAIRSLATRRQLAGLELLEAHAISAALAACEGNKKLAANRLGIARSTLYRKVRALGIDLNAAAY